MGMICEFYRLNDDDILNLKKSTTREIVDFLDENYASTNGKKHYQGDTVFSLDKAWDVTRYLIQASDFDHRNLLENIYGYSLTKEYEGYGFLLSKDVQVMNEVLQMIETHSFFSFYDEDKMYEANIYKPKGFSFGFILEHFLLVKLAFQKASNSNSGLIISIG
jgi:hypothetical protein